MERFIEAKTEVIKVNYEDLITGSEPVSNNSNDSRFVPFSGWL